MKTRDDLVQELQFHIETNATQDDVRKWMQSLSVEERQIIVDEINKTIERLTAWWDGYIVPTLQAASDVIVGFYDGLSPELQSFMNNSL